MSSSPSPLQSVRRRGRNWTCTWSKSPLLAVRLSFETHQWLVTVSTEEEEENRRTASVYSVRAVVGWRRAKQFAWQSVPDRSWTRSLWFGISLSLVVELLCTAVLLTCVLFGSCSWWCYSSPSSSSHGRIGNHWPWIDGFNNGLIGWWIDNLTWMLTFCVTPIFIRRSSHFPFHCFSKNSI